MEKTKTIKIIGPCSKFVDGQGWTTIVKIKDIIDLLEKEGYKIVKEQDDDR